MCFPFIEEVKVAFGVFEDALFVMESSPILMMGVIAAFAIFVIEFFRGIFSVVEISPRMITIILDYANSRLNDCMLAKKFDFANRYFHVQIYHGIEIYKLPPSPASLQDIRKEHYLKVILMVLIPKN